jgi:hypothetical protein
MLELSHPSQSQPLRINFRNELILSELKATTALQVIDELIDHLTSLRMIPLEARERIAAAVRPAGLILILWIANPSGSWCWCYCLVATRPII